MKSLPASLQILWHQLLPFWASQQINWLGAGKTVFSVEHAFQQIFEIIKAETKGLIVLSSPAMASGKSHVCCNLDSNYQNSIFFLRP